MGLFDGFRKKKQEVTPGGSPIYRYEKPEDVWRPPVDERIYGKEIEDYFHKLFPDRKETVFHELGSDIVHIDVHVLEPTPEGNFYVLFTTGMSDLPMTLPGEIADREDLKYAELYLLLPPDWDLKEDPAAGHLPYERGWPVQMLQFLARFPHKYKTWLGWGHSIPNGPDYTPIGEDIGFGGAVLATPSIVTPLEAEDGKEISFYMLVPAYKEEIEYKLKYGMEGLDKRFMEEKMPLVLDVRRPNYCADFHETFD